MNSGNGSPLWSRSPRKTPCGRSPAETKRVLNQDALEPKNFLHGERVLAGLQNRAAPSLHPVSRRPLAFNLETGAAVGQQQEARRACHQMSAGSANRLPSFLRKVKRHELLERFGPPDDGAKAAGPEEVVANAMPLREPTPAREIFFGVEQIDGGGVRRILNVESPACQGFVEIPRAPRQNRRGRRAHQALHFLRRCGVKGPFQNQKVDRFMTQGKAQVPGKCVARPVPLVKEAPLLLMPMAPTNMLLRNTTRSAHRRGDRKMLCEQGPPGELGAMRDGLLLEDDHRWCCKPHASKTSLTSRNML